MAETYDQDSDGALEQPGPRRILVAGLTVYRLYAAIANMNNEPPPFELVEESSLKNVTPSPAIPPMLPKQQTDKRKRT